jgi:hypothetical protein
MFRLLIPEAHANSPGPKMTRTTIGKSFDFPAIPDGFQRFENVVWVNVV